MNITINLVWVLIICLVATFLFLLHNYGGVKLFIKNITHSKDKDTEIASKFLDKCDLVSQGFMNKNIKEQNIENNQEIHELNLKVDNIYDVQNKILYILKNTNILQSMTLDEVKKK